MKQTPTAEPSEAYRQAVFSDTPPDPSFLVDSGRTIADYRKDRERFQRRQRARIALSEAEAIESRLADASSAEKRDLELKARFLRVDANAALQQSAAPARRERLGRLLEERSILRQRCEGRRETLDCEALIAEQRDRCGKLAMVDPGANRGQAARDYRVSLDELRRLENLRDQRPAAEAAEGQDRRRLAELQGLIDEAEAALLDPKAMGWDRSCDGPSAF